MLDYTNKDSIVALATPAGHGSISVVRISGKSAESIIRKCCLFLPTELESHKVYYGFFHQAGHSDVRIDEVLVTFFREGKSFSGENTFEISCHGSSYLVHSIIENLVIAGARVAQKGEFTFRAFMNGRIDLTQAEGVLSIIQSDSERSSRQALNQLGGGLRGVIEDLENEIIYCLAHIEASIDFSTEGLDTLNLSELSERLTNVNSAILRLISSYKNGRKIKDGYNLVLVGQPNVGKSSLLNALLGEDKAIVTPIAGTTRDVVTDSLYIDGFKVNLFDTAGLRDTADQVEKIGITKAKKALSGADGVLLVMDSREANTLRDFNFSEVSADQDLIIVANKADEKGVDSGERVLKIQNELNSLQGGRSPEVVLMSALHPADVGLLKEILGRLLAEKNKEDHAVISNSRHLESLVQAEAAVKEACYELKSQTGVEFVSIPLKEALLKLQAILGKFFDDQILDRVFKEFCLGK